MKKIIGILAALCLLFAFTVGCASTPPADTTDQAVVEVDATGDGEAAEEVAE